MADIFKMAVQFLPRETSVYGRFDVPRRMNGEVVQYEIVDGGVEFFRCDEGKASDFSLRRWNVPDGVSFVEFDKMMLGHCVGIGVPKFYDNKGNLLKIGNR